MAEQQVGENAEQLGESAEQELDNEHAEQELDSEHAEWWLDTHFLCGACAEPELHSEQYLDSYFPPEESETSTALTDDEVSADPYE